MRKQKGQKGFVGKKPNNYNVYLFDSNVLKLDRARKIRGLRSMSATIRALADEEDNRNGK